MQKNIKITINSKQYAIATDEDENDVYAAAHLVDTLLKTKVSSIQDEGKASLIVALQLATDLAKNKKLLQTYDQKVEHLISLLNHKA